MKISGFLHRNCHFGKCMQKMNDLAILKMWKKLMDLILFQKGTIFHIISIFLSTGISFIAK